MFLVWHQGHFMLAYFFCTCLLRWTFWLRLEEFLYILLEGQALSCTLSPESTCLFCTFEIGHFSGHAAFPAPWVSFWGEHDLLLSKVYQEYTHCQESCAAGGSGELWRATGTLCPLFHVLQFCARFFNVPGVGFVCVHCTIQPN